jgi:hypothetical protein
MVNSTVMAVPTSRTWAVAMKIPPSEMFPDKPR